MNKNVDHIIAASGSRKRRQSDSGLALIAVLWILLLLSIMALGYSSSSRLRAVAAANQAEAIKQRYHKDSALVRGRYEYDKYQRNRTLFSRRDEIESLTGNVLELWYPRYEPYFLETEHGTMAIQIRYEDGSLNVNAVSAELWDRVLEVCGIANDEQRAKIIDSVLDWIDADNLHHLNGVEMEHYMEQSPAYYCKNNAIQVLDELLLVNGVTIELYYGNDQHPGLIDFLSVYGSVDKIDINNAAPEALSLLDGLAVTEREEIIAQRQQEPFEALSELAEIVSVDVFLQLQNLFKIVQIPSSVTIAVSAWPNGEKPVMWQHKTYRGS